MKYALISMSRVLRVWDNPLLDSCIKEGYIPIPIYCFEPDYWLQEDEVTGIPRMMGTRFGWLMECLESCRSHLKQHGMDLYTLVGDLYSTLANLIEGLRTIDADAQLVCYSLSHADECELYQSRRLSEVCVGLGIQHKVVKGCSTFVNVVEMFPRLQRVPWYYSWFVDSCYENFRQGRGIVHIGT